MKNPRAKVLTYAKVADIRRRCARGEEGSAVAALYGVAQPTVSKIVLNKIWLGIPPPTPEERFWRSVEVRKKEECWSWLAGCQGYSRKNNGTGYGRFEVRGHLTYAHRFSYELHKGPIPVGLQVRHKCDNCKCVNPSHLLLGTNHDNVRDMVSRGRARGNTKVFGEVHPKSVLSLAEVRKIRSRCARGSTYASVARVFGVNESTIARIVKRETWKQE